VNKWPIFEYLFVVVVERGYLEGGKLGGFNRSVYMHVYIFRDREGCISYVIGVSYIFISLSDYTICILWVILYPFI